MNVPTHVHQTCVYQIRLVVQDEPHRIRPVYLTRKAAERAAEDLSGISRHFQIAIDEVPVLGGTNVFGAKAQEKVA